MPVEPEAMARARKTQPDAFAAAYPNIADWVLGGGWIEVGHTDYTRSFVRALDDGGMVFEGNHSYPTLDAALKALDVGINAWREENG
jgi:hypothetical protein